MTVLSWFLPDLNTESSKKRLRGYALTHSLASRTLRFWPLDPPRFELIVGYDLRKFERYYNTLRLPWGSLENSIDTKLLEKDPSMIIAWKENDQVIGHAIWHESNTEEHRAGSRRDEDDRRLLTRFLGQGKEFVEMHEVWLRKEHRGKGYGKRFFEFFENFAESRGFDTIVYYADDPAALAICRKRGYIEAVGAQSDGRPMFVLCRFL